MDYIGFADESGTSDRFTSIASFSFKESALEQINEELRQILSESDVSEFKWQKLKSAKYRYCAVKIVDFVWKHLYESDCRVDVVIWDNQDSRHSVAGRDDTANYGRMFYHLHHQSMKRRPNKTKWHIYPDEKVEIDWDTVNGCLEAVGERREFTYEPLFGSFLKDHHYTIGDFKQVESHVEPCSQVADLFSGMAVYSRTKYGSYSSWLDSKEPSLGLWEDETTGLTNSEENRFEVLSYFNDGCKDRKLGVSLKSRRRLDTPAPKNPINFWSYEPQHTNDTAPTK
ncbi:DUF3800 domain-containing protein [Opitutaceae bacterium]|nr:DUF3800 domain-containing protein [Opitutaceae bacterium]